MNRRSDLLLGLDLGTSGVKAILLDPHAQGEWSVVAQATIEYPLYTPRPGWSEQNPDDWWSGTIAAIGRVLERADVDGAAVAGLALSGQMHGATVLDGDGRVLRPCILWNDQRSGPECDIITARVGLENLVLWVGNPALAGFTAPKLLWMQRHEPDLFAHIQTVLLPKDYINFRLTGRYNTEVSDASGTLLFDVANRRWSAEAIEAIELPAAILPPVLNSTDVVGEVTTEAAGLTGLLPGTPVVAGGADNACAAVGMGVVAPGQVLTSIGTSGTVVAPTAAPRIDPQARLHSFCHAVPDTWYLMGVVLSAGGSLRWFRDTLGGEERRLAETEGRDPYDVMIEEAALVPPGSDGLIFLPYLTGERTPHGDPYARGVFFGLSLAHTRAHMIRSVLEGVTYALADSVALMRNLGVDVSNVWTTGGGARSALWRQLQADIFGARVLTAGWDTGPAYGAAVIAGAGVHLFPSIEDATRRLIERGSETPPDPSHAGVYRNGHALYDHLYPRLKDEFRTAFALDE